jgi:hypothetical protein
MLRMIGVGGGGTQDDIPLAVGVREGGLRAVVAATSVAFS